MIIPHIDFDYRYRAFYLASKYSVYSMLSLLLVIIKWFDHRHSSALYLYAGKCLYTPFDFTHDEVGEEMEFQYQWIVAEV